MSLIDLVAQTATRDELIRLLGATEEQRQILGREVDRLRAALKDIIDECTGYSGCENSMRLTAERALAHQRC